MLLETSTKCAFSKKISPSGSLNVWILQTWIQKLFRLLHSLTSCIKGANRREGKWLVPNNPSVSMWHASRWAWVTDYWFATFLVLFLAFVSDVPGSVPIFFLNSVFQKQQPRQLLPFVFEAGDWPSSWFEGHELWVLKQSLLVLKTESLR